MLRAVDVKAVIDMRGLMSGVVFDSRDGSLTLCNLRQVFALASSLVSERASSHKLNFVKRAQKVIHALVNSIAFTKKVCMCVPRVYII